MLESLLNELILNVFLMTEGETLPNDLRELSVNVEGLGNVAFP